MSPGDCVVNEIDPYRGPRVARTVKDSASRPLYERYADKAAELDVTRRTVQRWVQGFRRRGEAGLVGGDLLPQEGRKGR
jgi:Homeodomain-like domain